MNIFDVFTTEELDELPEDGRIAFIQLTRKAQAVLDERVSRINEESEEGWRLIMAERLDFMNLVVAAGRRLEVDVFVNYEVPSDSRWDQDNYNQFKRDLDHYLTQMALDNSIRGKKDGIELPAKSKDRIRQHIHALKRIIDQSGIDEDRKISLLDKLERFEKELEKRRIPLSAVGLLAITLLSAPGGMSQSYDLANKLITNIFQEVHEAKVAEDTKRQLPSTAEPAKIAPPRKPSEKPVEPAFSRRGMDDDIPF